MTTQARSIIQDAQTALQDIEGIRWPASDLVRYLNRAQRDIQTVRPDSTAATEFVRLSAGFRQEIPANAASLIDIAANATGERITKTNQETLDAFEPNWRKRAGSDLVRHYMHSPSNPRSFLVYPPATASSEVEMELSAYPVDVPAPGGDGLLYSTVTGDIGLADQFSSALLHLVLHYAHAKDSQFGANSALSASYLSRAESLLGAQLQSTAAVANVS